MKRPPGISPNNFCWVLLQMEEAGEIAAEQSHFLWREMMLKLGACGWRKEKEDGETT